MITSMPPLPQPLAAAIANTPQGLKKRERTRRQLLEAAVQVFSARGVASASIQEIAAVAGMANGTVYNHFETKEDMVRGVAYWLADTLCSCIDESYRHIPDGAERMAIGNRFYIGLAEEAPAWALLLLDMAMVSPELQRELGKYPLADLQLGMRQKRFRISSEAAAMDLIIGTVGQAMRSVAVGAAPAGHGTAVATAVLRALGMEFAEAQAVARRPLPPLVHLAQPGLTEPPAPVPAPAPSPAPAPRKRARATR